MRGPVAFLVVAAVVLLAALGLAVWREPGLFWRPLTAAGWPGGGVEDDARASHARFTGLAVTVSPADAAQLARTESSLADALADSAGQSTLPADATLGDRAAVVDSGVVLAVGPLFAAAHPAAKWAMFERAPVSLQEIVLAQAGLTRAALASADLVMRAALLNAADAAAKADLLSWASAEEKAAILEKLPLELQQRLWLRRRASSPVRAPNSVNPASGGGQAGPGNADLALSRASLEQRAALFDRAPPAAKLGMFGRLDLSERAELLRRLAVDANAFLSADLPDRAAVLDRLPAQTRSRLLDYASAEELVAAIRRTSPGEQALLLGHAVDAAARKSEAAR